MSQLRKKIERLQKREGPRMGFAHVAREQQPAMLLGVLASAPASARESLAAGSDFVIARVDNARGGVSFLQELAAEGACVGIWTTSLSLPDADTLLQAGCDFSVSSLTGTASAAVDPDRMGHVLEVPMDSLEDSLLRALGPLGLDGLLFQGEATGLSLAQQLDLVRLSAFSGTPLLVTLSSEPAPADLRTLRDSGCAAVILQEPSKQQITSALEALRSVPPPRRTRREGAEIAIVPAPTAHEHDEGEGDDE
jgi:hypothetical protein